MEGLIYRRVGVSLRMYTREEMNERVTDGRESISLCADVFDDAGTSMCDYKCRYLLLYVLLSYVNDCLWTAFDVFLVSSC